MPPVMTSTDAPMNRKLWVKTASPPVGLREIARGTTCSPGCPWAGIVVKPVALVPAGPTVDRSYEAWRGQANGYASLDERHENSTAGFGESPSRAGDS